MKKLRIAIIGEACLGSNGASIAESFSGMGHVVTIIKYSEGFPLAMKFPFMKKVNGYLLKGIENLAKSHANNLIHKVSEFMPDLVLNLYWSIHPTFIPELRKKMPGTKFVHINSDAISNFDRQQLFLSEYDFYFVKDPFIVDFFINQLGLNAKYLPECFNQRLGKKMNGNKLEFENKIGIDVLIYGNIYPYRSSFIKYLLEKNINVTIYGHLGPYVDENVLKYYRNEYLSGDRKSEIIFGSKVVINNFHFAEIESVNSKFFEIFGAGGFQLCNYKEIIKDYTSIDPELFTFKNRAEAVEKTRFYLNNPDKRMEISNMMYEHFLNHHTTDIRMTELLNIVYSA